MLMILLVFLGGLQPAASMPRPLPGNAALPYPESARAAGAEGDVAFRLAVDRTGTVTGVRFTDVARPDVGIQDAFVRTLLTWRFTPAMQAGAAVDGEYQARVTLEMLMPMHTARMYTVTPEAAWSAVNRVAAELKLTATRRDRDSGLLVMNTGRGSDDQELHVFVPPAAKPARVYLGSRQESQERGDRPQFNGRELNTRFYEALERELRIVGEPIPQTPWRRALRAVQLLPTDAPEAACLRGLAAGGGVMPAGVKDALPELIHRADANYTGPTGGTTIEMVRVVGVVGEDGYFTPLRLEGKSPDTTADFAAAGIGAASLYRFKPGRFNGCPVIAEARVTIGIRR